MELTHSFPGVRALLFFWATETNVATKVTLASPRRLQATKAGFSANVVSLPHYRLRRGCSGCRAVSDRFGRIKTLFALAITFVAGSVIQTASHGSYAAMLVGRAIGGIGVGTATMVVPSV